MVYIEFLEVKCNEAEKRLATKKSALKKAQAHCASKPSVKPYSKKDERKATLRKANQDYERAKLIYDAYKEALENINSLRRDVTVDKPIEVSDRLARIETYLWDKVSDASVTGD